MKQCLPHKDPALCIPIRVSALAPAGQVSLGELNTDSSQKMETSQLCEFSHSRFSQLNAVWMERGRRLTRHVPEVKYLLEEGRNAHHLP